MPSLLGLSAPLIGAGNALNAFLMLKGDDVPNEDAVAIAPTIGWLMLSAALALVVMLIVRHAWWRRWWLTMEDPRALALYRIVFGIFVIANMNDFFEYWTMLFTDEGIFTADVARQVHASGQFAGYGDGFTEDSPAGFFDWRAVWEFLKGPKYSLLYFWDSPTAFWIHMAAFQLCALMFIIGFRTRLMGVLTFFLMNSIFFRNHLFWEGTELVYRVFLAYLICGRSGHAYSVDNWLRCRKLRKQGLLSERDGPGGGAGVAPSEEHPKGLQAVYRLVPAWPRRLAVIQLAATYITTGVLKDGSVWAKGDAVYYAWNMDHFYRFYPQRIAALFGTNLLRFASWFAHWGEVFFFLGTIGVLIKWSMSENLEPAEGWRKWVVRACWVTLIGTSAGIIRVAWHVHFTPEIHRDLFVALWVLGFFGMWGIWWKLGRKPVHIKGRTGMWMLWVGLVAFVDLMLWLMTFPLLNAKQRLMPEWIWRKVGILAAWTAIGIIVPWATIKFMPGVVAKIRKLARIDGEVADDFLEKKHAVGQRWIATWVFGRRIWVTWHIALMLGIFTLMNIGQFQTGMLSQTFVYLYGAEAAWIVSWVLFKLKLSKHKDPLPAEDPTLPHHRRDAARMPEWALIAGLLVIVVGIVVRVHVQPEWEWRWIWVAGIAFLAGVGFVVARNARGKTLPVPELDDERFAAPDGNNLTSDPAGPKMPWAYGPVGRFIISALMAWHVAAVATWLTPEKDCMSTWRGDSRKVFLKWLTVTQTDQGWGMFAPNPPRTNVFLKVLVTSQDGEVFDLKTDVYAPERKPIPWIWNDRMRKMNRRIIGGESGDTQWYRKWYARYVCRQWALEHEGEAPKKVELVKMWYRMPSPEDTWRHGWYDPEDRLERDGAEKLEHTEDCKRTVMGQLPNFIRERHGLPPLDEEAGWTYKPWLKHKKRKWERKLEKEQAEAEGRDPPPENSDKKKTKATAQSTKAKKTTARAKVERPSSKSKRED